MGKNRLLGTAWVLLILVLFTTRWVCGLYARYTAEGSGGGSANAAAFVFSAQDKESSRYFDLSGIEKPGDKVKYSFIVTNQKGGAVSEVAERVRFTVWLNGSMPLNCTISSEEKSVLSAEITQEAQEAHPVERTETAGELPAAEAATYTYTMTVEWPAAANDSTFASRSAVAEVLLTVAAEQID